MNEIFNAAVGKISQDLRGLMRGGFWEEDLEVSLSSIEFSDEQIAAIKKAATPTTFSSSALLNETFSQQLTHAFRDPITKSGLALEHSGLGKYDDQSTMEALVHTRMVLQDIMHNYPLLLGEEMPGEVRDILDGYRDTIIPQLNDRITEIATTTGLDPETVQFLQEGWEHISALPEDVFAHD